jgi:polyhydroxybutyrate depolymerase
MSRRHAALAAIGLALLSALLGCSSSAASSHTAAGPSTTALPTTAAGPRGSKGCGVPPAVRGLTAQVPGDVALTFDSAAVERTYRLAVPASYDAHRPAPLLLSLHGSGSNALQMGIYTNLPRRATARGIIMVTPDAIADNWQLSATGSDDDFLVALVRSVEDNYCIDLHRVYVAGFSLGSWKSALMACTHPDMFAATALVAVEVHPTPCPNMPVIAFHGTADHAVPYGAGADPGVVVHGFNASLPGARDNIAAWATAAHCSTHKDVRPIGSDVVLWTYPDCAPGVDVELYTILHGDHSWPGAAITIAPTTHTIDATKLILDFFEHHPRRNANP